MNRENLLKVANKIKAMPYRQPTFSFSPEKPNAFSMAAGCGTACCVSAWTCEILGDGCFSGSEFEAQMLLGLNRDQAAALFRPRGWANARWNGARAARVLRLMAAGDGVTGKQIRAFWRSTGGKT